MKRFSYLVVVATLLPAWPAAAQVGGVALKSQWFTGSLEAPSPALPQTGLLAVEPYLIYTGDKGMYDDRGHYRSTSDNLDQSQLLLVLKYGLTDRLSIEALPSVTQASLNNLRATGVGDLPVELEYRLIDQNNKTGAPSITAEFGVSLPTGAYDHLHSAVDGFGSGAYMVKEGLLFQSLFETSGNHPVRIRGYIAAYQPIARVNVDDVSAYGTDEGFRGHVLPGRSTVIGIGAGYAFTQRWVAAIDIVENYADGFKLNGRESVGGQAASQSPSSRSLGLAPAIEYNWSATMGVIAGVEFSAAGRNTPAYVSPQIALSMAF